MSRYSRVKQFEVSLNAGVVFFVFLLLFSLESFSQYNVTRLVPFFRSAFTVDYGSVCSGNWYTTAVLTSGVSVNSLRITTGAGDCNSTGAYWTATLVGSQESVVVNFPSDCRMLPIDVGANGDIHPLAASCVQGRCREVPGNNGTLWHMQSVDYPSLSGYVEVHLSCSTPPAPLPCSDPVPIPAPECNGGSGLFMRGSNFNMTMQVSGMFGVPNTDTDLGSAGFYYTWNDGSPSAHFMPSPAGAENNPSTLPNGSQCQLNDSGELVDVLICPLGHESSPDPPSSSSEQISSSSEAPSSSSSDGYSSGGGQSSSGADLCAEFPTLPYCECQRNPSLPWCSGVGGSSGSNNNQSSGSGFDLCKEFPHLIFCQSSDSGGDGGNNNGGSSSASSGGTNDGGVNFGGGNGGNGNDPNGVTCLQNNNCNWARIDVQLNQLGVEVQTRDLVANIASLQSAGYNLTSEQNILLHSVLQAVNSGNADVVGAINGLANAVNSASSANGEGIASQLTSWQDMLNNTFGTNGSKLDGMGNSLDSLRNGFADGVADGLGKFVGDTTGTGEFNGGLSENGNGAGSAMGDSLGNGVGARNAIKNAIKIDSASFGFLGNSSVCPVWNMSFNAGIVSCNDCKIDLCNIYGFNAGAVIRAIIWLIALASVLFMNLQVLKTGGY